MNVIVVVSDTCRRDRIHAYGTEWMITPSLDYLASQSMVFNRAYCASFPTVPHRVDCLTGRYGFPFYGWSPMPDDLSSISEVLEEQGIATQLIHDTPGMHGANCGRGFRGVKFNEGQSTGKPEMIRVHDEPELPCDADRIRSPEQMLARMRASTWWDDESDTFAARTFADGCNWLAENQGADGFLLWVDTFDPHEPWLSPDYYVRMYYPDYDGQDFIQAPYDYLDDKFTEEEIMWMHARYCGELTMMDRWFGEFLDNFYEFGYAEDTALIFTSDHGFYFGEHNRAGKHTLVGDPWPLYEEDAGVPLMVYLPEGPRGVYTDAMVQAPDLRPTILDLLEVKLTGEEHGRSMLPVLAGETDEFREFTFSSGHLDATQPQLKTRIAVNSADGWALHFHPAYEPELYYLPDDPPQENNIVAENAAQADRLHRAFVDFLREVQADQAVIDMCRTWQKVT